MPDKKGSEMHKWMSDRDILLDDVVGRMGGWFIKRVFCVIRLHIKNALSKCFNMIDFCNRCGGDLCDYHAPSDLWKIAREEARKEGIHRNDPYAQYDEAGSYCFNCFCRLLGNAGISYSPELSELE